LRSLHPVLQDAELGSSGHDRMHMSDLFRFSTAVQRDPAVDAWLDQHPGDLGEIARHWFAALRASGSDLRELLHDGHPTACVGDAAFAYVDAFSAHLNLGFFRGAELPDPKGLLQGTGKLMRHVKLRPEQPVDAAALSALIRASYLDMRSRLQAQSHRSSAARRTWTSKAGGR